MHGFFSQLRYKFSKFMTGRYGGDEFSVFLSRSAVILWLVSLVVFVWRIRYTLSLLVSALFLYALFRCFSKNHTARYAELEAYRRFRFKFTTSFNRCKNRIKYRKTYKYFKCKNCKTYLRVPKGKGKIDVCCRVCGAHMIKRT